MIQMRPLPLPRQTLIAIASLLSAAAAVLTAFLLAWLFADLPDVSSLATRKVTSTTVILDRHGKLLYEVIDPESGRQIDLTLDRIPQSCIEATLATEDSRFYLHAGIDPLAIVRAAWQNVRAGGEIVSGGSTLTQQLVRILLLDEDERYQQTTRRKIREAWLAWRLERIYSKDELLALYLNQSYYGNFAFGLEAASQTFFAKPARQLSSAECALLAGLVQYPSGYNPLVHPEIAKARQLTVLRLMTEAGYLSTYERELFASERLQYRTNLFDIEAPHFVMFVQDVVARTVGEERLRQGGLRVTTSLDLELQQEAESAVRHRLDLLNCRTPGVCTPTVDRHRRVDNASAIVLDAETGEILAMVGSPDYFEASIQGNVNATLTLRQPGSAIKPLTYAVALDPGWSERIGIDPLTPASILPDIPITFYVQDEAGGSVPYQPVNYDRQYHGPVSVRNALANSYNIPAVRVLDRIGVESLRSIAERAGISSLRADYGLALTLGGGEVSLLELTAAYGVFQEGNRVDPVALLDIEQADDSGRMVSLLNRDFANDEEPVNVISPQTAFLISDILSDNLARLPAFGEGSVLELPFEAAVKTGTTTDWRDNWTIGYSTERMVGVWVGNADNHPMLDVSGVDGAGPMWRDIMLKAHAAPSKSFPVPDGIEEIEICAPSGLLPSPACPQRRLERFIDSTLPEQTDNQFRLVEVDLRTGMPASEETPPAHRASHVYWDLPAEYSEWAAAREIPTLLSMAQPDSSAVAGAAPPIHIELSDRPLIAEPASRTAYRIHPALPRQSQRLHIQGRTPDGLPWASLRILVDGSPYAVRENAQTIEAWWPLELGAHRFTIEGQRDTGNEWIRSDTSYIEVNEFVRTQDEEVTQPVAVQPARTPTVPVAQAATNN